MDIYLEQISITAIELDHNCRVGTVLCLWETQRADVYGDTSVTLCVHVDEWDKEGDFRTIRACVEIRKLGRVFVERNGDQDWIRVL